MNVHPPRRGLCGICGGRFDDDNLVVMLAFPDHFGPVHLHHVECHDCHAKTSFHSDDDGGDLCATLRDFRDGTIGLWWRSHHGTYWATEDSDVEDGDAWLTAYYDHEDVELD